MTLPTTKPKQIRYIKLGPSGQWAKQSIEQGIIPFGYNEIAHQACLEGDWERVKVLLAQAYGRSGGALSGDLREIQSFYELDCDTLWITFANGHLYWTYGEAGVQLLPVCNGDGPPRYRTAIGGWSCTDRNGNPLEVNGLSSALTKTANYQRTICRVEKTDYLWRRLRGEPNPAFTEAQKAQDALTAIATGMIKDLDWVDFETLIDLLFDPGGWRRVSILGQTMPDVDLIAEQSLTGERAWVQVKSKADQAALEDNYNRFVANGRAQWFYFACHSPKGRLTAPLADSLRSLYDEGRYFCLTKHPKRLEPAFPTHEIIANGPSA